MRFEKYTPLCVTIQQIADRPQRLPCNLFESLQKPYQMTHQYRQPALDLFGEVAITDDDLYAWVASVSPVHLHERGYAHYLRRYDVAGKVAAAKLRGTFDTTTARRPPPYHARLALHQIV